MIHFRRRFHSFDGMQRLVIPKCLQGGFLNQILSAFALAPFEPERKGKQPIEMNK